MKKNIFFYCSILVFAGIFFLGCVKPGNGGDDDDDDDTPGFYLKFKANGSQVTYEKYVYCIETIWPPSVTGADTIFNVMIQAATTQILTNDSINRFFTFLQTDDPVVSGKSFTVTSEDFGLGYSDPAGEVFLSASGNSECTMKITELTKDYAKGTFSGRLFHRYSNQQMTITDGEFSAKRGVNYIR